MALVISNAVLIRLIWYAGASPFAINVLGASGLGPPAVNQALANSLGAAIKAGLASSGQAAVLTSGAALGQVGVRSIGSPNQAEYLDSGPSALGTDPGNFLPPQVSLCVTLRTALAGKEFRGRVYLAGYSVNANAAGGTATPAATTAGTNFVTAIQTAIGSSGMVFSVLSRKNLVATPVTLIQSRDAVWDTQRRRAYPGI